MKKIFLASILFLSVTSLISAQNVGIGTISPDNSAILDLTSTNKGLLIPRMSATERAAIANPATGLLVYQSGGFFDGFYYYNGNSWLLVNEPPTGYTPWNTVGNDAIDSTINFIGTNNQQPLIGKVNSEQVFRFSSKNSSTIVGYKAGKLNTGNKNTYLGFQAGLSNTTGSGNVFIGYNAGAQETGENKLYISNSNTSTPLIFGDFSQYTPAVTVNGKLWAKPIWGNALTGTAPDISTAGVFATNYYGEAIVGRSHNEMVGAVVGVSDTTNGYGIKGVTYGNGGIGVYGISGISGKSNVAARFENVSSINPINVLQIHNQTGATGCGIDVVTGSADPNHGSINAFNSGTGGRALIGRADFGVNSVGVWGISAGGYAGYFSGYTVVQGNLNVIGTLSKSAGTFKIDHPLDPSHKYLIHSFVESPDMMNVYNGNIKTDSSGKAVVSLPAYFEAENIDFKYQLTIMDESRFAQGRISKKISNNSFEIMTDKPRIEVSWQVTGIRNDAYAQKNRIVAEVNKQGDEDGKYLYPELFNQPASKAIQMIHPKIEDSPVRSTTNLSVVSGKLLSEAPPEYYKPDKPQ